MTLRRRDFLTISLGAALWASTAVFVQAQTAKTFGLEFDPAGFETITTVIATAKGDRRVTYRFYKAVPYVARPVDVAYQCLNISVPVEIDGVAVDATNAPILLSNGVGGYMPSSVAEATGVDEGGMGGMGGPPKDAMAPDGAAPTGSAAMMAMGERVSNAKLALASGFVVVEPGARGRTLVDAGGLYYGVAPAAIVDLKAAVRYLRANAGKVPGNVEQIISSGTSAGGALSALLGASGDSADFAAALSDLGAAEASDAIFASADWCPIADLEHADMAYEWNWGGNALADGGAADAAISGELAAGFGAYQAGLGLVGKGGFGPLTAETFGDYLVQDYLQPAATTYLAALSEADRAAYLAANPGISWEGGAASFTWGDYLTHVGARKKAAPAFDAVDLSSGENNLFGLGTEAARHFTTYGLRLATGDATAELAADLAVTVPMMNPMTYLAAANPGRAKTWWIRLGSKDTDTALTVAANLAASLEGLGTPVDLKYYWDAGHGANEDADAFLDWIARETGYSRV